MHRTEADHSCGGSTGLFTGFPFHPSLEDRGTCARWLTRSADRGREKYSSGRLALLPSGRVTSRRQTGLELSVVEVVD